MAEYATGEGFSEEENLNVMMMMTENDPSHLKKLCCINTGMKQ